MSTRFVIDEDGNLALFEAVAYGLHDYGLAMGETIASLAPPHTSKRKVAYNRSIRATTYLNGSRIGGPDVQIRGYKGGNETQAAFSRSRKGAGAIIRTYVYTTNKLGHILEFGTGPHDIPVTRGPWAGRTLHHPGAARRPHFGPGFLSSRSYAGAKIAAGAQRALNAKAPFVGVSRYSARITGQAR